MLAHDRIPGLRLRMSEQDELAGMDAALLGEFSYDYDDLARQFLARKPMPADQKDNAGRIPDAQDIDTSRPDDVPIEKTD